MCIQGCGKSDNWVNSGLQREHVQVDLDQLGQVQGTCVEGGNLDVADRIGPQVCRRQDKHLAIFSCNGE